MAQLTDGKLTNLDTYKKIKFISRFYKLHVSRKILQLLTVEFYVSSKILVGVPPKVHTCR